MLTRHHRRRREDHYSPALRDALIWPGVVIALAIGSMLLAQNLADQDAFNAPNPHAPVHPDRGISTGATDKPGDGAPSTPRAEVQLTSKATPQP